MSRIRTVRDAGAAEPIAGTPTKTEHDDWVEKHGRPYTDNWFPWLGRPKTITKIKEGE